MAMATLDLWDREERRLTWPLAGPISACLHGGRDQRGKA
jgi:hypothetical protein